MIESCSLVELLHLLGREGDLECLKVVSECCFFARGTVSP